MKIQESYTTENKKNKKKDKILRFLNIIGLKYIKTSKI